MPVFAAAADLIPSQAAHASKPAAVRSGAERSETTASKAAGGDSSFEALVGLASAPAMPVASPAIPRTEQGLPGANTSASINPDLAADPHPDGDAGFDALLGQASTPPPTSIPPGADLPSGQALPQSDTAATVDAGMTGQTAARPEPNPAATISRPAIADVQTVRGGPEFVGALPAGPGSVPESAPGAAPVPNLPGGSAVAGSTALAATPPVAAPIGNAMSPGAAPVAIADAATASNTSAAASPAVSTTEAAASAPAAKPTVSKRLDPGIAGDGSVKSQGVQAPSAAASAAPAQTAAPATASVAAAAPPATPPASTPQAGASASAVVAEASPAGRFAQARQGVDERDGIANTQARGKSATGTANQTDGKPAGASVTPQSQSNAASSTAARPDTAATSREGLPPAPPPPASTPAPIAIDAGRLATISLDSTLSAPSEPGLGAARGAAASSAAPGTGQAPRFNPQAAGQLAAQISQRFSNGSRVFGIRLDPAELGRVDIRLEVGQNNRVQATLTVERGDTLAEMQRSSRELERALNDAGLELAEDGLSFKLGEGQDGGPSAEPEQGKHFNVYGQDEEGAQNLVAELDAGPGDTYGFRLMRRESVDLRV